MILDIRWFWFMLYFSVALSVCTVQA